MKNIAKILFVAISSFSLMFSANAGELTVSGTAKATYNATSGQQVDNGPLSTCCPEVALLSLIHI